MAGENTVAQLDGLFKEVYAPDLEKLYPENTEIADSLPFVADDAREGNKYHQPVVLARAQGYTLDSSGGTAFTLNAVQAATSKDAQINGAEFVLRESISYAAAARALKQKDSGSRKRAFVKATAYVLENMIESAAFVRELELLYGGGTGTASQGIGTVNSRTDDSGTSQTFDITLPTWADGIWAGMENAYVDVYDTTMATKRNSSGTMQVTAVDLDNRAITFLGTEAEMDNIVATDKIVLRGAKTAEMVGLQTAAANTGTLWNISASTYGLWKASTYSAASGSMTFTKMLKALNKPAARGLKARYCFWTSTPTWTDMMNDLAALRRYSDRAKGSLTQGANGLQFEGQSGQIDIKHHPMMKGGISIGYAPKYAMRVGATDITFQLPGGKENFFRELNDNAGFELRCYWNQAPFIRRMATVAYVTNIVNST